MKTIMKHRLTQSAKKVHEIRVLESRYRKLFNTSRDAIFLIDEKTRHILDVNKRTVRLFGFPESYYIGKRIWELKIFKDVSTLKNKCKNLQRHKFVRMENLPLRTKSGKEIEVEFVASIYHIKDDVFIRCSFRDVTKRRDIERKFQESEVMYRKQFESMRSGVVIYEVKNNGKTFIIQDCNKSVERIERVEKKNIIGRDVRSIFSGIDQFGILRVFRRVWKTGKPEHFPAILYKDKYISGYRENFVYKLPNGNIVAIYDDVTERVLNEERQREQEERYKAFFVRSRDAILMTMYPDTRIFAGNPAAIKMFGFQNEKELMNTTLLDLSPTLQPDGSTSIEKGTDHIHRAIKTGSGFFEWVHKRRDGSTFPATVFLSRVEKGQDAYLLATVHDVTKEKSVEEEIRRNLEQQKLLAEASVELNQYEDFDTAMKSVLQKIATHLQVNSALVVEDSRIKEKVIGKSYEWNDNHIRPMIKDIQKEAILRPSFLMNFRKMDLVRADNTSSLSKDLRGYLLPRHVRSLLLLPLKIKNQRFGFVAFGQVDAEKKWLDSEVRLVETVANSISSVFERRNIYVDLQEKAYQISKEKRQIEAIVQSIFDGVFVLNKELKITLFNKRASEISGFSNEEAINRPYREVLNFVFEHGGKVNDEFIRQVFSSGRAQEMTNHTLLVRKDGKKVPVAEGASPLIDREGNVVGCVVAFRDTTREREIDRIKTEFISVASHQLKTPLAGVKWMTELLLGDKVQTPSEKQKEYLKDVYFSNQRMLKLVDDLLDVSHIEAGKKFSILKRRFNLAKIIDEALKDVDLLAKEKQVTVLKDPSLSRSLWMFVDGDKIKQAFNNLFNNAIKYSRRNGRVRIGFKKHKDEIVFLIKDTGIGIPEEQQKRVNEKFFRADNAAAQEPDGTGLGLYIVKAIIEAHGGRLWFTSKENEGSTFYISLPTKKIE